MGRKKIPGLNYRKGTWHIDKVIRGKRICESTGTGDLEEAEKYLVHRMEQIRQAQVYGVRPERTFRMAATKFLNEATKASIATDATYIKQLDPFIGNLQLESVHMGSLQPYITYKRKQGVKIRTINYAIQTVRHILNLASGEWLDEHGMTWVTNPPRIKLLPETDRRAPYPMNWEEQTRLFDELPKHLKKMSLFKVNTGCREGEVCALRWEWEVDIPEICASIFLVPASMVKNRDDRLVVLNRVAQEVVDGQRGMHSEYVFTYKNRPVKKMYGAAWRKARERAGLPLVRVHDLKHTFGRRLRAAGVSFEDRQDLLGHRSGRVTTHYSKAELGNLIESANSVCGDESRKSPALVLIKRKAAIS